MIYKNIKQIKKDGCIFLYANVNGNKESEIIFQSPLESDLQCFIKENQMVKVHYRNVNYIQYSFVGGYHLC
jgi:hypothetical protein